MQEFRTQKIDLAEHTAVILTSKTAVDHFFRISQEMRFTVPDSMKYFCISEAVAYYLQKYVAYRKRKIFFGKQTIVDLVDVLKKHLRLDLHAPQPNAPSMTGAIENFVKEK